MRDKAYEKKNLAGEVAKTPFGDFILEATSQGLYRLRFPSSKLQPFASKKSPKQKGILSRSRKLLLKYLQGKPVSFASIAIDFGGFTAFERKVLNTLKKVKWGSSLSYSALAAKARFPRASRAVGSVMSRNRLPIFLPCHRVVTSRGKLGGYSAGLKWKERLLNLEGGLMRMRRTVKGRKKFHWETEEERLKRFMKISPKKKLEWLRQMNEFSSRYLPKRTRSIYLQLRRMK